MVLVSLGLRGSFGLFLQPMSSDLGWGREIFAFAMALQNLMWGVFQPFAGAIAEKWGTARVLAAGSMLYGLGLYIMSQSTTPEVFHFSAGLIIGMAQAGLGLGVVLGAVGRAVSPEKRSWALGIVTAASSAGQFIVVPIGQAFLNAYGWSTSFMLLALIGLVVAPLANALRGKSEGGAVTAIPVQEQSLAEALSEATRHRGFLLLTTGFFVCGFHVAFIAIHLPAYLVDAGIAAEYGATALALVGLFNIVGSYSAGVMGGRWSKKYLLSGLYLLRALVILVFILVPLSPASVLIFAGAMGLLWLSTVPLTSGLVAQIFGPRYMATLFGIVFFSHQIGSFLGVWLGGYLYDHTGSYMGVWWAGVALGVAAALVHWPIDEQTVPRAAAAQ
jgi:predicted MFS family arabinose efflux permease